ncbi:hypothetical protein RchiOBHm_Chr1g0316701 [Rosa chinensis]|uniref:Uncharacterized protein n=1 Tax=Rosa chinensis TaxID=74649 RepID=A0A2P6S7P2_ROSCH|nr:hypothetical protein RchiOBHm_Chr1g0316701 [Rosa chinensis]
MLETHLYVITSTLEQRCYKDLRTENFHSVKVVMCIYRKLLISFKDQIISYSQIIRWKQSTIVAYNFH